MARLIQGTCGLANIDNETLIRAEDVSYDNSDGLFPPGTDTVQEALEAAGGGASVAEMTPTVPGTAYGLQDTGTVSNLLGRDVNGTAVSATGRYQAQVTGTAQQASYDFAIFDENHCASDGSTLVSNAITLANNSGLTNCQVSDAIVVATNTLLNDTVVNNALVHGNTAELHDGALVRNDALYVNDSHLKGAQLDQACLHVTGLNAEGMSFDGAVMMGSMTNVSVTDMRESVFIGSNAGSVVSQMGHQSLYLGNQSLGETTNDREAWLSSYDRFFLRTLRSDSAPPDVCYYDPGTAELTYGPAPSGPSYVLPLMQPTVLGGAYGISSAANASQVVGENSFNAYAAGPVALSGVTAIGQQLYQASVPGTNNFTNSILIGRSHQFTGCNLIQNSMIVASITGNVGISNISESCMIVPRASSLLLNYTGACTGASFHSSGVVTCTSDPLYSTVVSSGGTVNPGLANLVLCSNQSGGSILMAGSGNTLISSSNGPQFYAWPAGVPGTTVIRAGAGAVTPSANNQLAANHTSLLMPSITAVAAAPSTTAPMAFDSVTGLISPTVSPLLSRVYRAVGTTVAGGTVTFTPGSGLVPSDPGVSVQATVRNTSTTTAYTCSISNLTATSIVIQVFSSVNVVLGSPSMQPANAGITVHVTMSW